MPTITQRLFGAALICTSLQTLAEQTESTPSPSAVTLTNAQGENSQWSGIGRLSLPKNTQCIATLIDSRDPLTSSNGPAYVITSGHCVDKRNGVIVQDQLLEGTVSFNFFIDTQEARQTFPLKRIVWSSMQGIDLALLELESSLEEVIAQAVTPLALGASPAAGSAVRVIGEPSQPDQGLRLGSCAEDNADVVIETPWVWRNVRRNHCPGLAEGASGSPVVTAADNLVVSVVNSVASETSKLPRCGLDNPCTPQENQTQNNRTTNYAAPVQRIKGCFKDGRADLSLESCDLLPAFQFKALAPINRLQKIATSAEGEPVLPSWNLPFQIDTPSYRYKTSLDALACEDPIGYSGAVAASENLIDVPIGPQPGWNFLCVIGVQEPDERPSYALMGNALSLPVKLLPAGPPVINFTSVRRPDGGVDIAWHRTPDLLLYTIKRGAPDAVDCDDPKGYRALARNRHTLAAAKLPIKFCTKAVDILKQESAPQADIINASDD
ncbi:trypsin-like peptidase domain-containing protein [Pseudomonas alkylphenolica]|uniref:trypsin-like peptidase domain-containing protein n=1 Tax=Pseudomonas alkylphenolica TaxID=237609 RepID=UPI0018D825B6|nr:trypsin-like peptidase domain-containing protein [Pseudomonas alkylphenolica]MBH3429512.1 trypsin-like peptidase domain-containing protein [Pseudomonas alkylphenolica]